MSPLGGLFGRKKESAPKTAPQPAQTKRPDANASPQELLKQATERQKAGDLDAAIALVERACQIIQEDPHWLSSFPNLDPFLKLARYYQQAGRDDDAWRLLNQASIDAMRHLQGPDLYFALANVSDQQRLALQRRGMSLPAIHPGVRAYLYQAQAQWQNVQENEAYNAKQQAYWASRGMPEQHTPLSSEGFQQQLQDLSSPAKLQAEMAKLLKPAKRPELLDGLVQIVQEGLATLPNVDYGQVGDRVRQLGIPME